MTITDPVDMVKNIDLGVFRQIHRLTPMNDISIQYIEPDLSTKTATQSQDETTIEAKTTADEGSLSNGLDRISSRIVTLGDFIDTDAVRC